jgi:hypothetical protein
MAVSVRRAASVVAATAAVVVVVAAAVTFGLRAVSNAGQPPVGESCTFAGYTLDTTQATVAATMVGVVTTRTLPARAAVLVLAGGLQESKLRNLPSGDGDRDSVGVLQQRPSQGWGTIAQLSDVHYATNAFLDALIRITGWESMPLAEAIQDVQISADGSAYAQHEPEAQALTDALDGSRAAGVSCTFPTPSVVASTAQVATALQADLPVNPPTTTVSTVSVPGAGWASAAWLVCNADRLGIEKVSYAERTWTRNKGWKTDTSAVSSAVVATMHTH